MDKLSWPRPGDELSNDDLVRQFAVGNSGGMRKSNRHGVLLLITNRVESLYEDHWHGDVLHYTGMGQTGDQNLGRAQNRTLAESPRTGVAVHLFEVFQAQRYTYQGDVELAGAPYQAQQLDREQALRTVWVFPLRLRSGAPLHGLPADQLVPLFADRVRRKSRVMSDAQVQQIEDKPRAPQPPRSTVARVVYARDPDVVLYALRRARGRCELCGQPAPFTDRDGQPFLEVHHVVHLARGGADAIDNVVALCPNCHRCVHVLERPADVRRLVAKAHRLLRDPVEGAPG